MLDQSPLHLSAMRMAYVLVCLSVVLIQMSPITTLPPNWAGPDLVLALTVAWALRRPEFMPALTVALVALLADFLLHRPPGLWAALVLAAAETLKIRGRVLRDQPFFVEWLTAAVAVTILFLGYRLLSLIFLIPQAPFGLALSQAATTILIYPVIVFLSYFAAGVRKSAPGEVDTLGHTL